MTAPGLSGPASIPGADVAYRQVRENVAALLAAGSSRAGAPVPHCPGWTIRDLVSHLVEVCASVQARVTGGGLPTMHRKGLPELLNQWERLSPPVEDYLARPGPLERDAMVMDAFTHELDLRQALGVAPPIDHPALPLAMGVLVQGFTASLRRHGLPSLAVETEHGRWVAGAGAPAATMSGGWYEVYLSLAGRRADPQIRSLSWSADPRPWLPAFTWGPFRMPAAPPGRTR